MGRIRAGYMGRSAEVQSQHARGQQRISMIYPLLGRIFPADASPAQAQRIVILRPCCIGDVVMATAALTALREGFPSAHISFAAGAWSARAIAGHPALDDILAIDDMPTRHPSDFWRLVRRLRDGRFDLAVSLVRSPVMSLAVWLAGIPLRAGIDSGGRGFGYNLRVAADAAAPEHEAEIYLRVAGAAVGHNFHAYANLPVDETALATVRTRLQAAGIKKSFLVAHPGGGSNPGAQLAAKRYPPAQMAALLDALVKATDTELILLGGPGDQELVAAVGRLLQTPAQQWAGALSFAEIGALGAAARLYIGNDSGLTHLAAASGAKTIMLMSVTDPRRYAPWTATSLALHKPESPESAAREILAWLQS
ncbi:MAG: glycosyltransferase family 9 protein [Chloroflexi bacterium]|nr:glycosyltransferase family 9 protein [Chloroflexota bacterium]